MIKIYCDKCGKEITENVNWVSDTTRVIDAKKTVVFTFQNEPLHICDECQHSELTCEFKVGDVVITADGRVGIIESFCDCKFCKERGFYEPNIKMELGTSQIYITNIDKENEFANFYQIGEKVFGNIDKQCVFDAIKNKRQELQDVQQELLKLEAQFDVIQKMKDGTMSSLIEIVKKINNL